jgi:hypothetical protein
MHALFSIPTLHYKFSWADCQNTPSSPSVFPSFPVPRHSRLSSVIPNTPRHSRAGGNPVKKKIPLFLCFSVRPPACHELLLIFAKVTKTIGVQSATRLASGNPLRRGPSALTGIPRIVSPKDDAGAAGRLIPELVTSSQSVAADTPNPLPRNRFPFGNLWLMSGLRPLHRGGSGPRLLP